MGFANVLTEGNEALFRQHGFFDHPLITDSRCLSFHVLGYDIKASLRNHAPGRPDAEIGSGGAPTVSPEYISVVSQSKFLELGFRDPIGGTIIGVGRSTGSGADAASRYSIVGKNGPQSSGINLAQNSATAYRFQAYYDAGGGATSTISTVNATMTSWACIEADWDATGQALRNLTTGAEDIDPFPVNAVRLIGSRDLAIGGPPSSAVFPSGTGDVAIVGIWGSGWRLAADERTEMKALITPFLSWAGITI